MKETTENNKLFIEQIKLLLRNAQLETARSVNHIMVKTYFELGKRIVENEQE
ncbi:MAG: N-terminal domain, partial [Bacteroidota bacterium]